MWSAFQTAKNEREHRMDRERLAAENREKVKPILMGWIVEALDSFRVAGFTWHEGFLCDRHGLLVAWVGTARNGERATVQWIVYRSANGDIADAVFGDTDNREQFFRDFGREMARHL